MMDYKIVYSNRKTLAIEVSKNLEIIVRAPFYVNEKIIKEFVASHEKWIEKALNKAQQRINSAVRLQLCENQKKELKEKAQEIIFSKVEYYSKLMGLKPTSVKITSAKTRFGSCSAKNSLCFSYMLVFYPDAAVDYVVVHELCHLLEMNHSSRFWALVEKTIPDYKESRRWLRTQGKDLITRL